MNIFQDIGWYFRNRDLISRVLSNRDVLALVEAAKEFGDSGQNQCAGSLHETLVNAGVDTKKLAEEIHPVGPQPEGPANPSM